ncbi:alpha/beta hydrolase [Dictyobacter alpinus]|uniref:Alpha/beta hydrolase n=1 Tax=Dictyobacter alpinus TaxID=2014873 RepID=A0A402BJM4_9CHLR|nr:alpha/beta hydrolase [Dictyobacter alpinus]GCE31549.1 alpha/beta hydrolase [Dictyobacter alpinus]
MAANTHNPTGNHAPVNGINLYYEVHGTGKPLIMLHGGFGTFDMFSALSPTLMREHQVIGVDLYAHGRTALTDRPIDFAQMADDIAGLIDYLELEKPDILGYSLGGLVALQTAIRHQELINKLVLISIPIKHTGWYPEVQAGMGAINVDGLISTPVYDAYKQVAPKPEDFAAFVGKMKEGMSREYDWTEAVSTLKLPTLIIAGDSDSFAPARAAEFFALLGGGLKDAGWSGEHMVPSQLAILPGVTHYNIIFQPDLLLPIISSFLNK